MPQQQGREQLLQRQQRESMPSFQHTQLGVHLAGAFGLMYLWASSAQGIVDKYHFSKRWFYLYGLLCMFAYLYMRPFVRRGLGSAGRGYLNFGTLYICWLCSAVFCHLPSFEALGIDIKADVSLGLSIAASSFLVLGVMHGVQQLLIHFKFLRPAPGATQQAVWTCVLLNTLTLAMTCSTYFQLCGNGGAREGLQDSSFLHQAVCMHWLAPIPTRQYPNFSAWMLYGEADDGAGGSSSGGSGGGGGGGLYSSRQAAAAAAAAAAHTPARSSSGFFSGGFSLWGSPPPPPPPPQEFLGPFNASQLAELVSTVSVGPNSGGSVISPVFTMWITLVALYIVNVLADHVAANNMSARHISELRRDLVPDPDIALLAQLSTAAGITLRENANQWAAAQQQRHEEARRGLAGGGGRTRLPGLERAGRAGGKKHSGMKRSKSLEHHRPSKQPWSPRYTMERALVNILETTSSFSFKAAALLEGKAFTWQDSLNLQGGNNNSSASGANAGAGVSGVGVGGGGRAASVGGAVGGGGPLVGGSSSRAQHQQGWRQRQRRKQPQQQQQQQAGSSRAGASGNRQQQQQGTLHQVSDSVGSMSPLSGAPTNTHHTQQQQQKQQLLQRPSGSMHTEPSFKSALPAVTNPAAAAAAAAAAAGGSSGGGSSSSSGSSSRLRGFRHHRSRSLSSIQSGDAALEDDDEEFHDSSNGHYHQQQQQQQQLQQQQQKRGDGDAKLISVPSAPPATSPFARAALHDPAPAPAAAAAAAPPAFDRCGFGSSISLAMQSPPSSHRWNLVNQQQQQQYSLPQLQLQQQQQHVSADAASTSSRGGGGAGGSPGAASASATPASSAAGGGSVGGGGGGGGTATAATTTTAPSDASAAAAGGGGGGAAATTDVAVQPPFLDMVPWYSGTSADLFKTMFDLLISVKLFLGRFDMRTMQAATAASMAEHPSHSTPQEGDGFTYEHFADRQELWFDFIADTGDGGNPTYAVARALAAHELVVPVGNSSSSSAAAAAAAAGTHQQQQGKASGNSSNGSTGGGGSRLSSSGRTSSSILEGARSSSACGANGQLELPRGEVLLIGGDLAYPNPSRETFEQRLFVPFQEAMPPPPHYHPGRLVVHKPDLPPTFCHPVPPTRLGGGLGGGGGPLPVGLSPRASRGASVAALRDYTGPNAFAIPGNHDWIDGLETFIQQIQHKGWLGGWLLPQEKSYFALRLPAGWWVFGLDLALVGDIDMCQYRYFANLIEQRLGPNDNVIIITHEPTWLLEWFWACSSSSNLRQLVRGHLRGRARVHLAGDLHFYMRHSYCGPNSSSNNSGSGSSSNDPAASRQNEASVSAAAAADGVGNDGSCPGPQQQQQTSAVAADGDRGSGVGGANNMAVAGGAGANSSSNGPAHDAPLGSPASSSSSSGVDSCGSLQGTPFAVAAAAGQGGGSSGGSAEALPPVHANSHALGVVSASSNSSSSSSGGHSGGGGSPVQLACKTLPRLQLNRSSFEGLTRPDLSVSVSGAAGGAGPHQSNSHSHNSSGVSTGTTAGLGLSSNNQQQHYSHHQPYRQQQHYSNGAGARSRLGGGRDGGGGGGCDPLSPAAIAAGISQQHALQQHSFLDPEHLIVNGMGGAFMHPTHVFSYSRFAVLDDDAATATAAIYSSSGPHRNIHAGSAWDNNNLSWHCPMSPSECGSELWDAQSPLASMSLSLPPPPARLGGVGGGGGSVGGAAAAAAAVHGSNGSNGSGSHSGSAVGGGGYQQQQGEVAGVHNGHSTASNGNNNNNHRSTGSSSSGGAGSGMTGMYKCAALFPSAATSLKLGRNNLHLFRFKNSRFDVIGGAIYFLSIVSILPRCSAGLTLLSSTSLWDFTAVFIQEFAACWYALFMESQLSLFMACAFFLLCLGFAKGGGVGAVSGERQEQQQAQAQRARNLRAQQQQQQQGGGGGGALGQGATAAAAAASGGSGGGAPAAAGTGGAAAQAVTGGGSSSSKPPKRRISPVVGPLVKLRTGGASNQLLVALLHTGAHLSLAIFLLLLLELGVETCIKYESLGNDGMGSMYRWFEAYQDEHFPDPMGLRAMAHKWSLGLYPGIIKAAMAVYDIPEAIAVVRNAVCAAPSAAAGFASLTRLQVWAYYGGMLAYYWLLATPAMGFVFGLYLYISVCWFHVHYDEAFSALRIANFKGLSRLHITPQGDLEIFTLGMERVPTAWQEDPRWYGPAGAGSGRVPAHVAAYPSRWVPAEPATSDRADSSGSGELLVTEESMELGGGSGGGVGSSSRVHANGTASAAASAASTATAVPAGYDPDTNMGLRLVDYVRVPRLRAQGTA